MWPCVLCPLIQNKRPMGHFVHLRKQFESINTYNYIITLISRRKNPLTSFFRIELFLFQNWIVPYFNNFEYPLPKGALCQVWLKLAQWFWKRFLNFVSVFSGLCNSLPNRFFNFVYVFLLFGNYVPLQKGVALNRYKLKFPLPKDALC